MMWECCCFYNVGELNELDISSFDESGSDSDISSLGGDLDQELEPCEAAFPSDCTFVDEQRSDVGSERSNSSEEELESSEDLSDLESDIEVYLLARCIK